MKKRKLKELIDKNLNIINSDFPIPSTGEITDTQTSDQSAEASKGGSKNYYLYGNITPIYEDDALNVEEEKLQKMVEDILSKKNDDDNFIQKANQVNNFKEDLEKFEIVKKLIKEVKGGNVNVLIKLLDLMEIDKLGTEEKRMLIRKIKGVRENPNIIANGKF